MLAYRAALAADAPALATLCAKTVAQPWSAQSFESELAKGSAIFVAEDGGTLVGFAVLEFMADEGYIHLVAVDENYRRRGIARSLLELAHKFAAEAEVGRLLLEVRCSNTAAVSLYSSLGYKMLARRRDFYSRPREDGFTMQKVIE